MLAGGASKRARCATIDPERVAYLMFHLGSFLVERETSGIGDYPFDDIMSLMDDIFAHGIAQDRAEAPRGSSG